MKNLPLFLLLLLPLFALAQNSRHQAGDFQKTEWSAYVSPDYTYRRLVNTTNDPSLDTLIDHRNNREQAKLGLSAGLSFGYRLNARFGLETGLSYVNRGYVAAKMEMNYPNSVDPFYGFVKGADDAPTDYRVIRHFHYLGLPLLVNYRSGSGPWQFFTRLGLVIDFPTAYSATVVFYQEDQIIDRQYDGTSWFSSRIGMTGLFSAGVAYRLNQHSSLRAVPTFRYDFVPALPTPIAGHYYNAGLQLEYVHRF